MVNLLFLTTLALGKILLHPLDQAQHPYTHLNLHFYQNTDDTDTIAKGCSHYPELVTKLYGLFIDILLSFMPCKIKIHVLVYPTTE